MVLSTDLNGRILYASKSWETNFGHHLQESEGQFISSFCAPDDQEQFKNFLKNALTETQVKGSLEHRLFYREGEICWVETKYSFNPDSNRLTFLIRNISERKNAELELEATTSILNETQQIAKVGGWVHDLKTGSTYWTDEVYRIHEVSYDFLENQDTKIQFIHPDDQKKLKSEFYRVLKQRTKFDHTFKFRSAKGNRKWVRATGMPIIRGDKVVKIQGIFQDITTIKHAAAELEEQVKMQEKLMNIATEYINFPIEEMDSRIQASLKEIGQFVNADRVYVIQYDFEKNTASNTHEWCADSIEPVKDSLQDVPMEEYIVFVNLHVEGKNFIIPNISKMEEGPAKTDLQRQQVKSLLTVPMMQEKECLGCVGFDSVKQVHDYSEGELKLLKLFSEVLVNALTRAKNDQELRSSQEQLTKLTASVPGAIFQMEMDAEGKIAFPFMSDGIQDLHEHLTPALLEAQPEVGFSIIHPEDLPDILDKIEQSRTNLTSFFADYRTVHPDDEIRWHRTISQPEQKADGTMVWYGIFQDITEQRKLEEIQKFAQELKVKNKEMEQFAYVASHDLQEPLRTIRSYSGLLNRRFSDQLGEDGQQFLNFIGDASLRMSNLIKGLLEYSQIGTDRQVGTVNCNVLLQEVLQDLNSSITKHQATIKVNDLPTLQGYKVELRQLFQNLISNAIKFHKPGEEPLIEIHAAEKQAYWQFSVKDNGIGIDLKYQNKISTIFQRLHLSKEYEGTGIGLANCKKIVEMHHGRIWLESEEGQGATFFFTLKKGGYDSKAE